RRRIGCVACRDLHGGGACVGYDRSAKHRLLRSAHYQIWQCSSARTWVAAARGCCAGPSGSGHPTHQALALMPLKAEPAFTIASPSAAPRSSISWRRTDYDDDPFDDLSTGEMWALARQQELPRE